MIHPCVAQMYGDGGQLTLSSPGPAGRRRSISVCLSFLLFGVLLALVAPGQSSPDSCRGVDRVISGPWWGRLRRKLRRYLSRSTCIS